MDRRHHRLRTQVPVRTVELTVGPANSARDFVRRLMKRLKTYCAACARELRWLRIWCPGCHRATISWLHVALVAALDAAALVYLLRLF